MNEMPKKIAPLSSIDAIYSKKQDWSFGRMLCWADVWGFCDEQNFSKFLRNAFYQEGGVE